MAISPGFYVCNSNDLDKLAVSAAYLMRTNPPRRLMECEQVVVMNKGMQTYLTQVIAKLNGICAQCDYMQIWQLIFRIHRRLHPSADARNLFSRMFLTLNILGLKPVWGEEPEKGKPDYFVKMRQYVEHDAAHDKAYLLAAKLADTLDQYQMYRPDWVEQWNQWQEEDFALFAEDPEAPGRIKAFIAEAVRRSGHDPAAGQALAANVWQMHLWRLLRSNLAPKSADREDAPVILECEDPLLYLDRAGVMRRLTELLADQTLPPERFAALPDKVFIFGVSALPPQVMYFLQALSQRCAVIMLLLNPCMQYWGDLTSSFAAFFKRFKQARSLISPALFPPDTAGVSSFSSSADENGDVSSAGADLSYLKPENYRETQAVSPAFSCSGTLEAEAQNSVEAELIEGNALLLGLGRQGMDNLSLLCALEPMPQFTDLFTDPGTDTLLHSLQHQLLTLEQPTGARGVIAPDDSSIEIHCCHTKLREIECVRDALLRRFKEAADQGGHLSPREVVVMVPTINDYAPYITAVFGAARPGDPNYLPYAICDRTQSEDSPAADAALRLLNISSERITSVLVTDLLSIEPVGRRFGLTPDDVRVLEKWLSGSAVYWGLDDDDTKEEAEIALPGTFERGLDRMILGTMAGPLPESGAYAEIEGDDAQILGHFAAFVGRLRELREIFTPHLQLSPGQWREALERYILEAFFTFDSDTASEREEILTAVDEMQQICRDLRLPPEITLPVFHALLSGQLSAERSFQPFLRGKVNFCSLVPMRAVPFRHIFILGLNDGDFPRRERMPGFNLLSLPALYRRGDRSRALDDRFLFLDALISARESIYFSYVGESPVSQQQLTPAVVLTELYDYLSACFKAGDSGTGSLEEMLQRLVVKEHLTAYHPDNFKLRKEPGHSVQLPSFDASSLVQAAADAAGKLGQERLCLGALDDWGLTLHPKEQVSLQDLVQLLQHPAKYFLERRMQIYLDSLSDSDLSPDEDFTRNAFANSGLTSQLLTAPAADEEQIVAAEVAAGRQPYGVFGSINRAKALAAESAMRRSLEDTLGVSSLAELQTLQLAGVERTLPLPEGCCGELPEMHSCTLLLHGEIPYRAPEPGMGASECVLALPYYYSVFKGGAAEIGPKALISAFGLTLGYYLATGQRSACVIIDSAGQKRRLNPLPDRESCERALNELLELYLTGLCRPLPCSADILKAYQKLKPEQRETERALTAPDLGQWDSAELNFLFGSAADIAADPKLAELCARICEFYQRWILAYVEEA